ncbi:FAD-dependent oxidoreductase [Paenibacillus pasadenensis]|uniref:FAD-dependent oxidoreductase n=1 Tax=Paenibacillus pasadenensis TaxID=217090 RepID=UPI0020416962|nr:FAD-dependent oxidoreductase [Paenibacillus pasadenensis]MCM3749971.1 FAD-dependent oxidoreductase [Paenibacillus pasadenensis]
MTEMKKKPAAELTADVLVIGGGLGGTAAALAAAREGLNVIMTEETDWIGGQLTSQAVPPDEHRWIETSGCTATFRELRNRIRAYYRNNYPLTPQARDNPLLNPGNGWVSRLAHEPKVALAVLEEMLSSYTNSGRLRLLLDTVPVRAETEDDKVCSVTVRSKDGSFLRLRAPYVLDATETGDLLPMTGTEYRIGAESRAETGEPHAPEEAIAEDVQAFTHVAAMEYLPEENFTPARPPEMYEFWSRLVPPFSPHPLLSWFSTDANNPGKLKEFTLLPNKQGVTSLWDYRRILDPRHLSKPLYPGDLSLLNWPQNDYYLGTIMDVSDDVRRDRLYAARQLSLSVVYWLQTEAPRLDGGKGYPGLRLRGDVLGTKDGLAKSAYIRESRRIRALQTVTEADVSKEMRGDAGIRRYEDSVGVGSYHLDLHHTTITNRSFYIPSYPYEIPLGALIPERMNNLLPACKNIGTTQISNGCYRLHPTEWNIGEAAGLLAAYCIRSGMLPRDVHGDAALRTGYMELLESRGVERHWSDEISKEVIGAPK